MLATGESEGYYFDYARDPRGEHRHALCATAIVYQGGVSAFRDGAPRGEPSAHLPPTAFVNFLQNHDQTGNRAFGERLTTLAEPEAVRVLTALLLLSPQIPLLFMGEEWGETRPFQFFCDFHGELADAVRVGPPARVLRNGRIRRPELREHIPDPNDPETFDRSKLDWAASQRNAGKRRQRLVRRLCEIRETEIMPRLAGIAGNCAEVELHGGRGIIASWRLGDGSQLRILANLGGEPFDYADPRPRDLPHQRCRRGRLGDPRRRSRTHERARPALRLARHRATPIRYRPARAPASRRRRSRPWPRIFGLADEAAAPAEASPRRAPSATALHCFVPEVLRDARVWGLTCQVPSLRSGAQSRPRRLRGPGGAAEIAAAEGADFLGVNPLHAHVLGRSRAGSARSRRRTGACSTRSISRRNGSRASTA